MARCCVRPAGADPADPETERLAHMSLEDLMRVPVTTVAGTEQSRMGTPAALYVITSEDIRRVGHRSVVEALRLVPGHVRRAHQLRQLDRGGARADRHRALGTRYLVLVDGASSTTRWSPPRIWDIVDLVLEDIDRIEVSAVRARRSGARTR
jgi:iron complex outermembrane receptor protein